jgi:hypothetical protein
MCFQLWIVINCDLNLGRIRFTGKSHSSHTTTTVKSSRQEIGCTSTYKQW